MTKQNKEWRIYAPEEYGVYDYLFAWFAARRYGNLKLFIRITKDSDPGEFETHFSIIDIFTNRDYDGDHFHKKISKRFYHIKHENLDIEIDGIDKIVRIERLSDTKEHFTCGECKYLEYKQSERRNDHKYYWCNKFKTILQKDDHNKFVYRDYFCRNHVPYKEINEENKDE